MPQTSAGAKNNAWIAYMRQCAKTFREEQAKAKPPSRAPPRKAKAPPTSDQAEAKAQLDEWKSRQEARQRELSHANMKRATERAQKAEAAEEGAPKRLKIAICP